jgi:hypothetical protein
MFDAFMRPANRALFYRQFPIPSVKGMPNHDPISESAKYGWRDLKLIFSHPENLDIQRSYHRRSDKHIDF